MSPASHPLDPLSATEISKAANIVRQHLDVSDLNFRFITLREPRKADVLAYLSAECDGTRGSPPARMARVQVIAQVDQRGHLHELLVDLHAGKVDCDERLAGKHSFIDGEYMQAVEKACLADAQVQAEIETLRLPDHAEVVVEAWAYATDGMNDLAERITMCWFYLRMSEHKDANYYAYPIDICAEVNEALQVTKVYRLPSRPDERIHDEKRAFDQGRIHSHDHSEYHPDLRAPPRTSTTPYRVTQPDGPSFQVHGNRLAWDRWTFRIGFNYREGLTLHDIRYDGQSLFYRLSLAEMFVPYGDPRSPYPRKGAFDLGNDGAGINANNLRLGCDCLGAIRYFSFWHNTSHGEPLQLPNVVCCHEQDDGILWKHTNFRTGNPVMARSRILVLQTIITVSNYEYIFAFHFGQDASITYEVRATGILSTSPINRGDSVPWGTIVAPGTLAAYHQHLFCLRIDPAVKGPANSLRITESHPLAQDDEAFGQYGVGYHTTSQTIHHESGHDLDHTVHRTFHITNPNHVNPVTGSNPSYQLVPHYSQLLLAHPQSHHARRSEFGQHAVWVTKYVDDELFPAGRHTMQSAGGEGIASQIARRRAQGDSRVENEDIVVWHTFGSTHNPRAEDWPVMPCEKMSVGLKPVNFFERSPAMDVVVAGDAEKERNGSVLA